MKTDWKTVWTLHCHLPVFVPSSLQERLDSLNNPVGGRFTGQGEAGPTQQAPRQGAGQESGQGGSQDPGQRPGQPQRGGRVFSDNEFSSIIMVPGYFLLPLDIATLHVYSLLFTYCCQLFCQCLKVTMSKLNNANV